MESALLYEHNASRAELLSQARTTEMPAPKIPGGNRRVRFGRHEGKTFANVYNKHRYYVLWVVWLEDASGPMLDLQRYFAAREGRPPPTPRPESKPMFIGLDIWDQVMNIEVPMK